MPPITRAGENLIFAYFDCGAGGVAIDVSG
jgi:hypothetical protein